MLYFYCEKKCIFLNVGLVKTPQDDWRVKSGVTFFFLSLHAIFRNENPPEEKPRGAFISHLGNHGFADALPGQHGGLRQPAQSRRENKRGRKNPKLCDAGREKEREEEKKTLHLDAMTAKEKKKDNENQFDLLCRVWRRKKKSVRSSKVSPRISPVGGPRRLVAGFRRTSDEFATVRFRVSSRITRLDCITLKFT